VSPKGALAGIPLEVLGEAWWTWYFSADPASDKLDSARTHCHDQFPNSPVVFLAGSSGEAGLVQRTCRVGAGKPIFLPIITVMSPVMGGDAQACRRVAAEHKRLNDVVPKMEVEVDGLPVADMDKRRVFGYDCTPRPGGLVFDGYWLALKPLTPGTHRIRYKARYNSMFHALGQLGQDIQYDITVR
jgi:hypothetical protein